MKKLTAGCISEEIFSRPVDRRRPITTIRGLGMSGCFNGQRDFSDIFELAGHNFSPAPKLEFFGFGNRSLTIW
jgi:hypothetical protein